MSRKNPWQDIQTAPKDGTVVFLGGGTNEEVCDFDEDVDRGYDILRSASVSAMWHQEHECWVITPFDSLVCHVEYLEPLYWMPIPPLPKFPGEL